MTGETRRLGKASGLFGPYLANLAAAAAATLMLWHPAWSQAPGSGGVDESLGAAKLSDEPQSTTEPVPPDLESLRAALRAVRCGVLDADTGGGRVTVVGTIATSRQEEVVAAILRDHAPVLLVDDAVRYGAPALCDPLSLLESQRRANAAAAARVSIRPEAQTGPLHAGQSLVLNIVAPDFPAHLQVDYYTADGNVVHLLPNPLETSGRVEPRAVRRLGDRKSGGRFWTIGPPFGDELVVVVASALPLFMTPRPEAEAVADYLPELKRALDTAGPGTLADARFIATEAW